MTNLLNVVLFLPISNGGSRDTPRAEMKKGLAMTATPFLFSSVSFKARHRPR